MMENSEEQFFIGKVKKEDVGYSNNIPDGFEPEDSAREFERIKDRPIEISESNIDDVLNKILKGDNLLEFNITDESLKALRSKYLQTRVDLSKIDPTDPAGGYLEQKARILKDILGTDPKLN